MTIGIVSRLPGFDRSVKKNKGNDLLCLVTLGKKGGWGGGSKHLFSSCHFTFIFFPSFYSSHKPAEDQCKLIPRICNEACLHSQCEVLVVFASQNGFTGHGSIVRCRCYILGVQEPARSSTALLVRESGHARAGSTRIGNDLATLLDFVHPVNV
jgi:hypothetical protein